MLKKIVLVGLGALAIVAGWHIYLTGEMRRVAEASGAKSVEDGGHAALSLNPVNNVAHLALIFPPSDPESSSNFGAALGKGLAAGLSKIAEPIIEHELNTKARESFDLYAWAVPYRVRITVQDPDPATVAEFNAQRAIKRKAEELKKQAEEQARRQKITSYIQHGMGLENVKVAAGENFGRRVDGVFGTIINKGDKTLDSVAVRIYFLDATRNRIGEKEYHPILVSKYSGDNTPLRPGYRKDFGYSIDREAPTNWAKNIEAEIVDVKFSE